MIQKLARASARTHSKKGRLAIRAVTKDSGFFAKLSHYVMHIGDPQIDNYADLIKTMHFNIGTKARLKQSANSGAVIKYKKRK